ncbi:hypothetical protein CC85DRAFT_303558 [Cutaneotrichosporon oleaginosum]|uniref:Transglutaminase-like domain-containing protein n=1 Tax=Cutaneotrichosporon oleaginosum TaxID=879819 RepID=A0A0J1B0I8_9TREE|nr:uncharacterized protein CC85DRAFT_303558 [Cutaneotrichosporon oleaginosum]KLT41119.1 hypothetical protein CC85DRAFT_303558 [Cutaneotrichosporon oleaginosum]TXT05749.1 hypothetical protein COLE_07069 [Cutaneotrichosporon oleaginosum]
MPAGPIESGYVAHQLQAGVYDSIPSLQPGGDTTPLEGWMSSDAGRAWARAALRRGVSRAASAGNEGVLAGLKKHSWEDAHLTQRAEIGRVLAHLPERAEALLRLREGPSESVLSGPDSEVEKAGEDKKDENGDEEDKGEADDTEERFSGLPPDFGYDDALVLAAARWFKHEYFRWADPIACACGGATAYAGPGEPSADDRAGGAARVELHRCAACGATTRFPRYNTVRALMRARVGRCGEFAQLFYVFLLALGLEARYVWNSEDHMWAEYWSPALQHWVHVDACEAEVNKPLLYDRGWGKMQAYCLAFGVAGAEDVTRAYVDDWGACLRRRQDKWRQGTGWGERRLAWLLLTHTVQCRGLLEDEERLRLQSMDEAQARWVADAAGREREAAAGGLKGRESGTEEWKEARGETGK